MDPFEYVVVITSLITGLGIAQILTGLADIISQVKKIKLSIPLLLLIATTFLNHVQEWFYNYQYATLVDEWTLKTIMGLLIYPILLYVLARMLFPTGLRSQETDLEAYYFDQWPGFFIINILSVVVSIFHDFYISKIGLIDQTPKFVLIGSFLLFLVFRIQNKTAHLVFQLLLLIGILAFLLVTDASLIDYQQP